MQSVGDAKPTDPASRRERRRLRHEARKKRRDQRRAAKLAGEGVDELSSSTVSSSEPEEPQIPQTTPPEPRQSLPRTGLGARAMATRGSSSPPKSSLVQVRVWVCQGSSGARPEPVAWWVRKHCYLGQPIPGLYGGHESTWVHTLFDNSGHKLATEGFELPLEDADFWDCCLWGANQYTLVDGMAVSGGKTKRHQWTVRELKLESCGSLGRDVGCFPFQCANKEVALKHRSGRAATLFTKLNPCLEGPLTWFCGSRGEEESHFELFFQPDCSLSDSELLTAMWMIEKGTIELTAPKGCWGGLTHWCRNI